MYVISLRWREMPEEAVIRWTAFYYFYFIILFYFRVCIECLEEPQDLWAQSLPYRDFKVKFAPLLTRSQCFTLHYSRRIVSPWSLWKEVYFQKQLGNSRFQHAGLVVFDWVLTGTCVCAMCFSGMVLLWFLDWVRWLFRLLDTFILTRFNSR